MTRWFPSSWSRRWLITACLLGAAWGGTATDYHLHPLRGDDTNPGTSARSPLRSLEQVAKLPLQAGDRVLLAAGQTFAGQLTLNEIAGTAAAPIVISTYADSETAVGPVAKIDAAGHLAGVFLRNAAHVRIENLAITANGGGRVSPAGEHRGLRCGVLVQADRPGDYAGVHLSRLMIHDVSFEEPGFVRPAGEVRTANGSISYGWGIRFMVTAAGVILRDLAVTDCQIENVNHTGLKFTAPSNGIQNVCVERVRVLHSGGPGVQMSGVRGGHFSGLYVNGSGSTNDTRNWGRGSGLWTWQSSDVIIEQSQFLNANGPGDSAGVHIDYHCRNVIVQHNLSANNAGGFCEILGNNYHCAYRYNVSVNDGHRVKGEGGAFQEGKIFWLSGYVGKGAPRGPFNSYFYNNTIYVSSNAAARIAVGSTAEGVLIANNIFYFEGRSQMVVGDQSRPEDGKLTGLKNVVFENNLFLRPDNWPAELGLRDRTPIFGDPKFRHPGGLDPADYLPRNTQLVRQRGIRIPKLPQDETGLTVGLEVERDILGNEITDRPGLGAIQVP